jgi:hypothetical protein
VVWRSCRIQRVLFQEVSNDVKKDIVGKKTFKTRRFEYDCRWTG